MKKGIFCLLVVLLLCFTVTQAVYASDDDVDIDIPIGCEEHEYGSWSSKGNGTHVRSCIYCHSGQTQTCTWNGGTETKPATCKEEGQKVYTCTVCRGTKTEAIPRLTTHTPGNSWQSDKDNHWRTCTVCSTALEKSAHQIVTGNGAPYCSVCSRVMETQSAHVHNYASAWTTNETGHWHACSGCAEKSTYGTHSFKNACDTDCDTCGYTRTVTHSPESNWNTDKNGHWKLCSVCGQKCEEAAHTPGEAATATTAQKCTVCGFELVSVIAEEPTEVTTEETTEETTEVTEVTKETTQETTEETEPAREQAAADEVPSDEPGAPWLFVAFAVAVAVVIALVVIDLCIESKKTGKH